MRYCFIGYFFFFVCYLLYVTSLPLLFCFIGAFFFWPIDDATTLPWMMFFVDFVFYGFSDDDITVYTEV